jgi:hypothetical protein
VSVERHHLRAVIAPARVAEPDLDGAGLNALGRRDAVVGRLDLERLRRALAAPVVVVTARGFVNGRAALTFAFARLARKAVWSSGVPGSM